jgi:hypothetical protein
VTIRPTPEVDIKPVLEGTAGQYGGRWSVPEEM